MLRYVKNKLWWRWYRRYLKSSLWNKKRYKVLRRDKFKCVRCGSKNRLQVHHQTYSRVGKERLSDLITLCKQCHKKKHR